MLSFCAFIVRKKNFLCMLLWFYIFHGLDCNIFTFSVAQCSCWCDFIYGVNYFIWMYFSLICLYSLLNRLLWFDCQ